MSAKPLTILLIEDDDTAVERLRPTLDARSEIIRVARLDDGLARLAAGGVDAVLFGATSFETVGRTLREREERLAHDALHDALTGLPNRTLFLDRLGVALKHRQRDEGSEVAIIVLGLDRFRRVNDSLGHTRGDDLLVLVAERLAESVRAADTVARIGGDEFAVLLDDVGTVAEATHLAERIQARLASRFVIDGEVGFTTASMGIALSVSGYERPREMLRDADIAMHRAKAAGKARYEVFDHDMHRSAVALLKLETDLRLAIREGRFVVHYQPIVSLATERLVGFEALVRWRHPERGLIAPEQFIAVAEETGLIVPLGWWVLGEACAQTRRWQERFGGEPPLSISVNVSGKLFRDKGMVDRLDALLAGAGLDPGSLRLELTESVVLDHAETVLQTLSRLRALGVQLHIDDFGTGYSSLSYLQRFPYDTVKIDRSFISSPRSRAGVSPIVRTIINLCDHLKMNVIAEGVETAEQARQLREVRCPQAQGFWFAKPLGTADAEAMLTAQRA